MTDAYEPTRIEDIAFPDWVVREWRDIPLTLNPTLPKTHSEIQRRVWDRLANSQNPFWSALHLSVTSSDYKVLDLKKKKTRSTMTYFVMEAFVSWLRHKTQENFIPASFLRDDKLLVSAFAAGYVRFNLSFYRLLARAYQFHSDHHRPLYEGYVRRAVEDKRFVQAGHYVVSLRLQDAYELTAIAFPLYAMNEMAALYEYLWVDERSQARFVALLDSLGRRGPGKAAELAAEIGIPKAVAANLEPETLFRNVLKLATRYDVPEEHWPGMAEVRLVSSLSYFMRQSYEECGVPEEDFECLLADFLQDSRKLQKEAIEQMCKFGDTKRAVYFARKYGFKEEDEDLPCDVRDALGAGLGDLPLGRDEDRSEMRAGCQDARLDYKSDDDDDGEPNAMSCAAPSEKFYAHGVNPRKIHSVRSKSEFDQCIADVAKNAKTVAVDCEWRPLSRGKQPWLSLILLATDYGRVYLLDLPALNKDLASRHWRSLVDKVFRNPTIEKLAFSIKGKLKLLSALHVVFAADAERPLMVNLTDVMTLCTKVLTLNPGLFQHYEGSDPNCRNLSAFVGLCLGKPLDETQRFSDWDKRPLRKTQVSYAVAVVSCLLDIYEIMQSKGLSRNIVDMVQFKA